MSQMGQKAKYSLRADVFRFGPDSGHVATAAAFPFRAKPGSRGTSFNDLGRNGEEGGWPGNAEFFGGLQIDNQIKSGGQLDRQIAGFGAAQNLVNIFSC